MSKTQTSLDAEQQIIGAILIEPALVRDVAKKLRPADFEGQFHREAFATITRMQRLNVPIDVVSVKHKLSEADVYKDSSITPAVYMAETGAAVTTTAHCCFYTDLVVEAARKRSISTIAATATEDAKNGKPSSKVLADMGAAIEDLQRANDVAEESQSLEKFTLEEMGQKYPNLPPPIIDGIVREGEVFNIIAPPKVGKS